MKSKINLLIGNSSGIGKEVTKKLLVRGLNIVGISKSDSDITHSNYTHIIQDVADDTYRKCLEGILSSGVEIGLCIYFTGIGDGVDYDDLRKETKVFEVNLMAAVVTTEMVLTKMLEQKEGHFIGLSSIADIFISDDAPSYSASKSAVSKYWEGLGLGLRGRNIKVSNIRFGFVDTKMAKSPVKPFLLSVDKAANYIISTIDRPIIRLTRPFGIIPLAWGMSLINKLKIFFEKPS